MGDEEEIIRTKQCDQLWRSQAVPKFVKAGLSAAQIDVAKKMFVAGFEAGWDSHKSVLMQEFLRENQKQKVHLA